MAAPSYSESFVTQLHQALTHWQAFDLNGQRESLDQIGLTIADNQDKGNTSRKNLADATKDFKKLAPNDKQTQLSNLLRQYQQEIDVLTRRSRYAETSFLKLYKTLADAPDPVPLLTRAGSEIEKLGEMVSLDVENKKLRAELEEYQSEFRGLKNQDVTIENLKKKIATFEKEMGAMVDAQTASREKELQVEFEKKELAIMEKEAKARSRMEAMERQVLQLQRSHDSTSSNLFSVKERFDEEQASRQTEAELVGEELERARQRIVILEKQLTAGPSKGNVVTPEMAAKLSRLELELAQKDVEIGSLVEDLHRAEQESQRVRTAHLKELDALRAVVRDKEAAVVAAQAKLTSLPSTQEVDELRRQLRVLRSVEFGKGEVDSDDEAVPTKDTEEPLEEMLMRKNRTLQGEAARFRSEAKAKDILLERAQGEARDAQETIKQQRALITKLEEDLASGFGGGGGGGGGDREDGEKGAEHAPAVDIKATGEGLNTKFAIVTGQRDRLKTRVNELESESNQLKLRVAELTAHSGRLQEDNLQLYEKIRYLESYDDIAHERSTNAMEGAVTSESTVESRYRQLYEDATNPFTLFHRKQKNVRYAELNVAEKVTLSTTQFFMSSKFARMFVFFYSVILHLLVFSVLYYLSHTSSCAAVTKVVKNIAAESVSGGSGLYNAVDHPD